MQEQVIWNTVANEPNGHDSSAEAQEELAWLMSLALDDDLSQDEAERMEALLDADPAFAADWQTWQALDQKLYAAPEIVPPPDFAVKFGTQLAGRERWRKVRTGILFGVSAMVLWCSALAGLAMLSVFFWNNQASWIGDTVEQLTYWWAAVSHLGDTLRETGSVLMAGSMARWVLLGYVLLTAGILGSWFGFLRRSLNKATAGIR